MKIEDSICAKLVKIENRYLALAIISTVVMAGLLFFTFITPKAIQWTSGSQPTASQSIKR